jgi:hypothetical protein
MKLTRRQITVLVASLICYQEQFTPDGDFHREIDELVELLDAEHQKLIEEV